jgi:hypothetical protein
VNRPVRYYVSGIFPDQTLYEDVDDGCEAQVPLTTAAVILNHNASKIQHLSDGLDAIARLGNGEHFGNSTGNVMALNTLNGVGDSTYLELRTENISLKAKNTVLISASASLVRKVAELEADYAAVVERLTGAIKLADEVDEGGELANYFVTSDPDYDPTPYCSICFAVDHTGCDCPPFASNE